MRVKLSYSVDIEEIMEEVSELFDYVSDKSFNLDKQVDTTRELLIQEKPEGAKTLMQKMRKSLGEMDARLADLCLILQGYIDYQEQQAGGENDSSNGRPAVGSTDGAAVQGAEQSNGGQVEREAKGRIVY